MSSFDVEVTVDATPERVWAIVGDLAATDRWVAGVTAARLEGTRRICTLQDGGEIHEEIAVEAPERRAYRYRHVRTPLPVETSSGRIAVLPDGAGARVVMSVWLEARDPSMQGRLEDLMRAGLRQSLDNLKRVAEAGPDGRAEPAV